MQIRHFARVFWRWLWLILLGTLICAGATYVISKKIAPTYEASALIQVNDVADASNSGIFNNQAAAVSYAIEVTNTGVLTEVARTVPGVSVTQLQTDVSAAPLDNTALIEVRADAHDAQQAAAIANAVADVFIRQQIASASAVDSATAAKLSQQLAAAKDSVDHAQATLTNLVNSQASQTQIAHQADVLNNYQLNYNSLLTSYNQVQLQENLIDNSLTIAQSAVAPDTAKGPHTSLNVALGAALAFLLMLAFVLLLDWLDTTIKTPEDVARMAQLEPLGSIPLRFRFNSESLASNAAIEQAFVTISTSFKALGYGKRSILVTGLRSGAGTSLVASQLAFALVQSGLRVLLIDANISNPTQHETFNLPDTRGLTNSLNDIDMPGWSALSSTWLKQWVTGVPGLYLLPAGPQATYMETIRRTAQLQMLAERLLQPTDPDSDETGADEIDMIIIDAPALDQGASAIALAPVADGVILVVRAGKERPESLRSAQATFQRLGTPILGVVINRQRRKHQPYFYANGSQQAPIAPASIQANVEPKYPTLKKRAFRIPNLPETPLAGRGSRSRRASSYDNREPRTVMPVPGTPDDDALDATIVLSDLSKVNSLRSGENQGRQVR